MIIPVMRYEDDCRGLEEDTQGTVVDRVQRLWKRVENVVKTSNCATKNSRTNSIKGGECRNPLKKKKRKSGRVSLWWSSRGR